jgi:LPS O-antigen subunit length determinant protein (WzzB/FepE family)
MNFLTAYEAPLRSYIQDRIALLENALEEEVRNRDNIDITLLEQQFDRESEHFIAGVTRQIHQIRDEIKAHRPTNIHSSDYETRMIQYRQFIQSSSISMNRMTDWINSIFEQLTGIVKLVVQWMAENSQTIIDILGQIRDAFKFIGTFFHYH